MAHPTPCLLMSCFQGRELFPPPSTSLTSITSSPLHAPAFSPGAPGGNALVVGVTVAVSPSPPGWYPWWLPGDASAPPPRLAGGRRSVPGDVSGLPAGLDVLPAFPRL